MPTKNTKSTKTIHAFTLVELLIVITILSILALIAFVSFQNFTRDSRDGNRLATLVNIDQWLNLLQVQTGTFPDPDGDILTWSLLIEGAPVVYSNIWTIWESISRMIQMNKIPLDPLSNHQYIYAVNTKKDKYQIATSLENLEVNTNNPIISQTYANDSYKAKVMWNHEVNVKLPKDDKVWFVTIPSMIFTWNENILNSSWSHLVVNGWKNLPYAINNTQSNMSQNWDEVMQYIKNNSQAKIITIDITQIINEKNPIIRKEKIEQTFWTWSEQEILPWITSKQILASVWVLPSNDDTSIQEVENIIIGWSIGSAQKLNCEWIADGWKKLFWNISTVNYWENCPDAVEFICKNWVWTHATFVKWNYPYASCIVWKWAACEATTLEEYNIWSVEHTSTYNAEKIIPISNGSQTYKQTFICENGNFSKTWDEEILIPNCNENYIANWSSCVLDSCSGTRPENSELNGTQWTASWSWSQNNTWLCKYKCIDGYETASCTPKQKVITNVSYNSKNFVFTDFTLFYNSPQTKTSQLLNITNGTSTLTAQFTLDSDGTTFILSNQVENITCNTNYILENGSCIWKTFTVTFDSQWWTSVVNQNVVFGNTYGTLPTSTKSWFTFNGWYTLNNWWVKILSTTNVESAQNHTLYAQWTANQYTVTFDKQWWTGGNSSVISTYASTMPNMWSIPTKSWCTFQWYFTTTTWWTQYYTSAWGSAKSYDIANNSTLYAQWGCSTLVSWYNWYQMNVSWSNASIRTFMNHCQSLWKKLVYNYWAWWINWNTTSSVSSRYCSSTWWCTMKDTASIDRLAFASATNGEWWPGYYYWIQYCPNWSTSCTNVATSDCVWWSRTCHLSQLDYVFQKAITPPSTVYIPCE